MYKCSYYNHIVPIPEKKIFLIYNALSGGLLELQSGELGLIKKLSETNHFLIDQIPKNYHKFVAKLISYSFINNVTYNEKQSFKNKYLKHKKRIKNKKSTLALTLAPTMNCNFACIYCFEQHYEKRVMSKETVNNIVTFVKNELENEKIIKNIKKLFVTWFGGEPLMTSHLIKNISKQFIDLAKKNDIDYYAEIVTNGSLLNQKQSQLFKECKIKAIQITLDGAQKTHDKRRPLKNNSQGTYLQILKNVSYIPENVELTIRINCDKEVWANINKLFDDLEKYEIWPQKQKSVKLNLGFIIKNCNSCFSKDEKYFSYSEFVKIEEEFRDLKLLRYNRWAIKNNLSIAKKIFKTPKLNYNDCMTASYPGGLAVDPEGYIHKCWENIDKIENRIMHITDPYLPQNPKLAKWLNVDKFYRKDCQDCKFLPVCDNGCTIRRLENSATFNCSRWKYQFKSIIKKQYLEMVEHPEMIYLDGGKN